MPQWLGDLNGVDLLPLPMTVGMDTAAPLGSLLNVYALNAAHALGMPPSSLKAAIAVGSGGTAIAALFLWARRLSPEWPLLLAMLLSSGFTVIFYGYVERATPVSAALACWYVYLATEALLTRRRSMNVVASAVLSLACLVHGAVFCFLPAHVLVVWRGGGWRRLADGVAGFLVPIAAFAFLLWIVRPMWWGFPGDAGAQVQWFKQHCVTNCGYDFFSFSHLGDIINCVSALSPIAVLCLADSFRHCRSDLEKWLAWASVGGLLLMVTWFPVLGYLPDWDLFVVGPLAFSCFSIVVGLRVMGARRFRSLAAAWIVATGLHLFSFWRFFSLPM